MNHSDMEQHVAQGVAEGRLHPETFDVLADLWPGYNPRGRGQISAGPVGPTKVSIPNRTSKLIHVLDY